MRAVVFLLPFLLPFVNGAVWRSNSILDANAIKDTARAAESAKLELRRALTTCAQPTTTSTIFTTRTLRTVSTRTYRSTTTITATRTYRTIITQTRTISKTTVLTTTRTRRTLITVTATTCPTTSCMVCSTSNIVSSTTTDSPSLSTSGISTSDALSPASGTSSTSTTTSTSTTSDSSVVSSTTSATDTTGSSTTSSLSSTTTSSQTSTPSGPPPSCNPLSDGSFEKADQTQMNGENNLDANYNYMVNNPYPAGDWFFEISTTGGAGSGVSSYRPGWSQDGRNEAVFAASAGVTISTWQDLPNLNGIYSLSYSYVVFVVFGGSPCTFQVKLGDTIIDSFQATPDQASVKSRQDQPSDTMVYQRRTVAQTPLLQGSTRLMFQYICPDDWTNSITFYDSITMTVYDAVPGVNCVA